MDKNAKHYPLNVTMPQHCAYVVRDLPQATVEQRERALNATRDYEKISVNKILL